MHTVDFILDTLGHFVRGDDGPPPGIPVHVGPQFEQELTWLCEWHALTPIVLSSLERLALRPRLSRIAIERLRALSRASGALGEELTEVAVRLARSLGERGIDAMLMRDVALRRSVYPAAEFRPVEAVTILIREDDWARVLETCAGHGFKCDAVVPAAGGGREALSYYQHYPPCLLENENGDRVEFRFRLFDIGPPDPTEIAWRRGMTVVADDAEVRGVGLEDLLIDACVSYNMMRFGKLLVAADIGLILARHGDRIDWAHLDRRVRARGIHAAVSLTMRYVERVLKLRRGVARLPAPGRLRERVFSVVWVPARVGLMGRPPRPRRMRYYLVEHGGWAAKARFLARMLSPRREWVEAFFDEPYRPWLRFRFVLLALRGHVGMRASSAEKSG